MKNWIVFDIETLGLDSTKDQITCICALDDKAQVFEKVAKTKEEEIHLLSGFISWCNKRPHKVLVTKNGKSFDVPFIVNRSVMVGYHDVLPHLIKIFKDRKHLDVQEITKRWVTLEDMATLMRLDSNKTMTGLQQISIWKQANKLFLRGEEKRAKKLFDSIKEYCNMDVLLTMQIAQRHNMIKVEV